MTEKTTPERLAVIETKVTAIGKTLISIEDWIKERDEHSDKKYASKWVEKLTSGALATILVAVIGALLGLILVKPTHEALSYLINLV